MTTRYISPTGSGLRDGSSPQNAGTLSNLNAFVAAAGAGGQVLLLADKGTYHQANQITLSSGGSATASVTIRGVDSHGNPMAAEIAGSRAPHWTPGHTEGNELFRLTTGANNLNFRDLAVENVGNGVFRAGSDIHNLSISHIAATNVTRFFDTLPSGSSTTATVTGLKIEQVTVAGYSKGAINLGYDSHGIVIKNVVADSQGQKGGLYVVGVHLTGTVHDVVLASVEMKNSHGKGASTAYWNGDGFATESGVHGVKFQNTVASGNTDAGYDIKSSNTVLDHTVASGNNENYRFWSSSITMTDGVSIAPHYYGGVGGTVHVWMADGAIATLDHFTFSDSGAPKTLFNLTQTGAILHLVDTNVPQSYADHILLAHGSVVEMAGGAGNDLYPVHATNVLVVEAAGHGTDTVATDLVGYTLCANVENLTLTGGMAHTGNGNGLNNVISGESYRDVLHGLSGNDSLSGAGGNDILHGDLGADKVNGGTGIDQLFGDAGDDALWGGAGNDKLDGGAGKDRIDGGDGNDTLQGGAGNDTLAGGQGADIYLFGRGSGHDSIINHDSGGAPDTLRFGAGIDADDLWLTHHGNDLVISVVGSGDSVTLVGWYANWNNRLSGFELADGEKLGAGAIQQEVHAMASVVGVPASLSALTHEQHAAVVSAIAASWH
jgi:Ca2+-binding RTX toxin-like protein